MSMPTKRARSTTAGGGSAVPLIAQEPPALRPRVTDMMTPDRLAGMISAMETLLANAAAGSGAPLDTSPDALPDALNGAYLRDWSDLRDGLSDAEPHYPTRAGVRLFSLLCLIFSCFLCASLWPARWAVRSC